MASVTYTGAFPADLLNMNDGNGTPWARRQLKERREAWHQLGWAMGNSVRPKPAIVGRADVTLEVGTNRPFHRRDPHNFMPTMKYLIDGFTAARLWPDDNSKYVHTNEPIFTAAIPHRTVRVTIQWEEAA